MEINHYCFTRGYEIDYGNFAYPQNVSKQVLDKVKAKALNVINDASDDRNLSIPKWILIKEKDFVAWGICCNNSLLTSKYSEDYKNRPVRGFFAIIITDYTEDALKLPYDIAYFKQLYTLEVEPYWEQKEQHRNKTIGYIDGSYNYINAKPTSYLKMINVDVFKCHSLGNVDTTDVVMAVLCLTNTSLVIDNDNKCQATENGGFMNCISKNVSRSIFDVKQQCRRCKKFVSHYDSSEVCDSCISTENQEIIRKKEMEDQLRKQLENANKQIRDLNFSLESAYKKLERNKTFVKVLLGIITLLTIIISFLCKNLFNL